MTKPTREELQIQYDEVRELQSQLWQEAAVLEHMLGGVELDLTQDFGVQDLDDFIEGE